VVHEIPLTNSISDSALISRIHEAINDTVLIANYETICTLLIHLYLIEQLI